jgi:hypothetical protein
VKAKEFLKTIGTRLESVLLALIFLFTFINWLLLTLAEKLGPPDVYKLYSVAEKLFAGNFKIGIVPPLFPLVQYPLAKVLVVLAGPTEAFVLAGRIISLAAGMGALWFSYLVLKKWTGKFAVLGITFLAISPWFLKMLSFPITDMLYLFFVSAAFYSFLPNKSTGWGMSVLAIGGGVLTRFEGVLLILSGFLNYFKFKKKYFYIILVVIPVMALLLFLFSTFADRFFAHLRDIILAQKSYLFIFQHPMDFLNMIYGNILFFIPFSYPYFVKLVLLLAVIALFCYGAYRLFKMHRNFTLAVLVYELLFLVAKGYVDTTKPEIEFRRLFSGLWIFYLICFVGGYFFIKKVGSVLPLKRGVFVTGLLLMIALSISLEPAQPVLILIALPTVPVILLTLKDLQEIRPLKYPAILILLVFLVQVFSFSFVISRNYVASMAPKASFTAAQWLNIARIKPNATILSYTDNLMMDFYLDKQLLDSKNIIWETFTIPLRFSPETKEHYMRAFFKEIRERNVDYIISDNYVVPKEEFWHVNQAKRMLFEERENKNYFRVKKYLFYKGENVGYILKPVDVQTNH